MFPNLTINHHGSIGYSRDGMIARGDKAMRDILGLSGAVLVGLLALMFEPFSLRWSIAVAVATLIFLWSAWHLIDAYLRELPANKKRHVKRALIAGAIALIGAGAAWHFWPVSLELYGPFAEVYGEFKDKLGNPIEVAKNSSLDGGIDDGATQAFYADGIQVSLKSLSMTYVFPRNHPDREVEGIDDPVSLLRWETDTTVRKKLCSVVKPLCDVGCRPPVGGSVDYYLKNPNKWTLIGCRDWGCILDAREVYSQRFERGI
jgi:hypothetical protein